MLKHQYSIIAFSIILLCTAVVACSSSSPKKDAKGMEPRQIVNKEKKESQEEIPGAKVYKKHCRLCHGKTGDKGLSGAKDLTVSALNMDERTQLIRQGKGTMKPYQGVLTGQEIDEVAEYITTLRVTPTEE